jgi:3'(2'), 5'-bisphosphate nucleotidase
MNINQLVSIAIASSLKAGGEILDVYSSDFSVENKEDKSPLTEADKRSHEEIMKGLEKTGIPVLSEEGEHDSFEDRKGWNPFWLVDPLDGTKEFVKRNGEFTVNIALVKDGHPSMGVIYVPVLKTLYVGVVGHGARKWENIDPDSEVPTWDEGVTLPVDQGRDTYIMVGSRSHMSDETTAYMEKLRSEKGAVEVLSKGSSLKLCMVAEGSADRYPRFAPTMEWDTGAGHAICKAAGFKVDQYPELTELQYNKENLLNPWFLVH